MARLNEPAVSTDGIEILRRKFLRQNRDIARVNSTQSLKIRSLENECARLLSENLELRGNILRLKTELEGSHVHRVADHALQIKEKMEAQLLEWGTMLASLGHEPVPKNRSPRALKRARIHGSSIGRSRTSDWRRRDTMGSMQELEMAALQEGRLAPLWENKTCPRETLNQDEILALCSEAEESTDSPDIGPPPVSRFVDEDPVKLDLSTLTKLLKPALSEPDNSDLDDASEKPASCPSSPARPVDRLDTEDEPSVSRPQYDNIKETATEPNSQATLQIAKTNLKRKIREEDEKENVPLLRPPPLLAGRGVKDQPEKGIAEKAKATNRPIKELPINKKESREKPLHATQRKPLGAKSSNGALGTAKKPIKVPADGKEAKPKLQNAMDESTKDYGSHHRDRMSIDVPAPGSPEPVTRVDIEPMSLSADPNLAIPDTPETTATREEAKDTPPPVDISSNGETTRGNRRARAAVSYAEPNLRDKMRRPNTKEIFDAVAGDGRNIRRTSQCQRDEPPSGPSSAARSGARTEPSRKDAPSQRNAKDAGRDVDIMASPSVQKIARASANEELPASVTTDRKKKDSATAAQDYESDEVTTKSNSKGTNRRLEQIAAREAEVAKIFDDSDVYEFTDSSQASLKDVPEEPITGGKGKSMGSRQSRSRRLSSITPEDLQSEDTAQAKKLSNKGSGSRKRASMAAIKSTARSDSASTRSDSPSLDGDSISTVEGEVTIRDKAASSRRRTTMI